jgi:hypothetical protein
MICEYWDVYVNEIFTKRIHYQGYIGRYINDNRLLTEKVTIKKGEFHV